MLLARLEDQHWSIADKFAIARREARIGFSHEQLELALGKPTAKASEKTAAGVTEVWTFPLQLITFKAGKVTSIKKIE